MDNLNVVTLQGGLTRDPELRTTAAGGVSICTLRIGFTQSRKVSGEWTEVPGYIEVTAFGKEAENCQRFLTKGRQVIVKGRIDFSEWGEGDQRRSAIRIAADRIYFIGGNDGGNNNGNRQQQQQSAPAPAAELEPAPF